jgi:hypothetical protein
MKYIAYSLSTNMPRGMGDTAQAAIDSMSPLRLDRRWVEIIATVDETRANRSYAKGEPLAMARLSIGPTARTVYRGAGSYKFPLPAIDLPGLRFPGDP